MSQPRAGVFDEKTRLILRTLPPSIQVMMKCIPPISDPFGIHARGEMESENAPTLTTIVAVISTQDVEFAEKVEKTIQQLRNEGIALSKNWRKLR